MPEKLKDYYFTEKSLHAMMTSLTGHYPRLDAVKLRVLINDSKWNDRELKEKMHHVARCLREVLPASFDDAVDILLKAAPEIKGWESMSLPDFVEIYGREDWEKSMFALTEFTKHSSSEFAIRPFLLSETEKTIAYLEALTENENEDVRRYASEGCRPRHPWGMALPNFKKDPVPILPVLEKLKDDESEYVRRSVANNLNDISKDNPGILLDIAERWYGHSSERDALVKHACRTLLKRGNRRALELFGYGNTEDLIVSRFTFDKRSVALGGDVTFSFALDVQRRDEAKVRLEYAVYYVKANGSLSRKVFQISERVLPSGSCGFSKTHKFIERTTRKHYRGTHYISVIVNGEEMAKEAVEITIGPVL